jgi:undecaprenyl-phosphate 4-deoxy-4-formamido-L-arabinose transferase
MSAVVVNEITRYDGPFPYVDGLILQVTQDIDRLLVRHLPRAEGRSNYTMRRLLRLWLSMFVNFSVMPLRLSTLTGFALSLIGTVGSIVVITEALFFAPPAGWASLMAAVLLLSGVQLLILGIVGEYLGRMYLTANKKPQSIIKTVMRVEPEAAAATRPPLRLRERA